MSGPAYVVMPAQADGSQRFEPVSPEIQDSLNERFHSDNRRDQEEIGPLKKIIAHQDSLYKYISWEDPVRTLGSYVIALSILCGAHYVPLTRLALKAVATSLGAISLAEFGSRLFGPNTFLARLRPEEYQRVPESTLNATLQDVHDFVQYAVVKVQRLFFAQDLNQTFAAFVTLTSLYWLIKIVPPFGLAVMGLTSLYIAPLVTSPRAREAAQETTQRAGELANAAAQKGSALAQDGKAQAADLTSKAQQTGIDMKNRIAGSVQNTRQTEAGRPTENRDVNTDVGQSTQSGNYDDNRYSTDGSENNEPQYSYSSTGRTTGAGSASYPDPSTQIRDANTHSFTGGGVSSGSQFSNNRLDSTTGMGPIGNTDTTHYRTAAADPLQDTPAYTARSELLR
ncbi:hypothetical protein AK830_g4024 [Neonectria ditissima]|uniref:Reticulon domain-containing protein n=1 Tax=Neonectria ditissima TaxID=78410 RepID=A0A0P7AX02_9HYPO|nr:hypothetical protein AK830_g4024 [Neonectria ditissima]